MAWTKAKMAVAIGVTAILAAGTTAVAVKTAKHLTASPFEVYFEKYDTADLDSAPPVLLLRPTRYAGEGDWLAGGKETGPDAKVLRRNCSIIELLSTAYGISPEQMVLSRNLPKERFDLLLTVSNDRRQALQAEIKTRFGLVAHSEKRDTDIAVLKSVNPDAPGLKTSSGGNPKILLDQGHLKLTGYRMSGDPVGEDIAHTLGTYFVKLPVIDETKLTGTYDIDLSWNAKLNERGQMKELESALRDQLGLQLSPGRRRVDMLVVEKTN